MLTTSARAGRAFDDVVHTIVWADDTEVPDAAPAPRIRCLVSTRLPGCLSSPLLARAYGRAPCCCSMDVGDSGDLPPMGAMSTSFAYRCRYERTSTRAGGRRIARALTVHLQRIARG